jgi:hypothetical protein
MQGYMSCKNLDYCHRKVGHLMIHTEISQETEPEYQQV